MTFIGLGVILVFGGVLQMTFQPIWRGRLSGRTRLRSRPSDTLELKDRPAALGSKRIGLDLRWSRLAPLCCWPGLPSEFETDFANALGALCGISGRGFGCSSHVSSWQALS